MAALGTINNQYTESLVDKFEQVDAITFSDHDHPFHVTTTQHNGFDEKIAQLDELATVVFTEEEVDSASANAKLEELFGDVLEKTEMIYSRKNITEGTPEAIAQKLSDIVHARFATFPKDDNVYSANVLRVAISYKYESKTDNNDREETKAATADSCVVYGSPTGTKVKAAR